MSQLERESSLSSSSNSNDGGKSVSLTEAEASDMQATLQRANTQGAAALAVAEEEAADSTSAVYAAVRQHQSTTGRASNTVAVGATAGADNRAVFHSRVSAACL